MKLVKKLVPLTKNNQLNILRTISTLKKSIIHRNLPKQLDNKM